MKLLLVLLGIILHHVFSDECILTSIGFIEFEELQNTTNLNIFMCGVAGWSAISFSTSSEVSGIQYSIFASGRKIYQVFSTHPQLVHTNHSVSKDSIFQPKFVSSRESSFFKMNNFRISNVPIPSTMNWTHVMFACHLTKPVSVNSSQVLFPLHEKMEIYSLVSGPSR
jgi:hypothetical protein